MHKKVGIFFVLLAALLAGCNPNKPPVVQLSADKAQLYANIEELRVQFSASDPEGAPVACTLNFGDGTVEQIAGCTLGSRSHTYTQAGTYTVTFTARDDENATAQKSLNVTVLDSSQTCYAAISAGASAQSVPRLQGFADPGDALYVPGELIALPTNLSGHVSLQSAELSQLADVQPLRLVEPPAGVDGPTWVVYRTVPGQEAAAARALLETGAVRYVQPNYVYAPLALTVPPNDTFYAGDQRAQFQLAGLESTWPNVTSENDDALDSQVAIIDSGVARTHADLSANWSGIVGKDFSSENGADGQPTNNSGAHGTLVASIVAAATNNNEGVAGVTYNTSTYVSYKVFPDGTSDALAQAIGQAVSDGADIINLSLCILNNAGTCANLYDNPDALIENALQQAYNAGLVTVAASGNYASNGDTWVGYPASSPYTLAVGSVNSAGQHSSFSNPGTRLDLVAPGEDMAGATYPIENSGSPAYVSGSGTSFAAPFVAGVAALYVRQYRAAKGGVPTPKQVATCLCATAEDRGPAGFDTNYGAGIVRADRALDTSNPICYP